MQANELSELTRILQTAISPVALISGIGLLILAMTNRFSHTIDRARALSKQAQGADAEEAVHLLVQVKILYERLRYMMLSIGLALASIFFISLLVTALFAIYLLGTNLRHVVVLLFILSLACLVSSLALFIRDIGLSLSALKEELRGRV